MTPQELIEAAKCYASCVSGDMQAAIILYLLDQLRIQNGGDEMTPQELQEAAKCFMCINDQAAAQTYLLNELLTAQS